MISQCVVLAKISSQNAPADSVIGSGFADHRQEGTQQLEQRLPWGKLQQKLFTLAFLYKPLSSETMVLDKEMVSLGLAIQLCVL